MAFNVVINGNTYTEANFEGQAYADEQNGFPACLADIAAHVANFGSATSTTSLTIGTGSKSLTITANKAFAVGQVVLIARTSDATNFMFGTVTAYTASSGSMTVDVSLVGGTGTFTDWTVALSGLQGPVGPATNEYSDTDFRIQGSGDNTKKLAFEVDGISPGTTRTVTAPDESGEMVLDTATQTLTNKELGSGISLTETMTVSGSGAITGLPSPSVASDAATKSYVDAIAAGLAPKKSCRVATTANLTATYSNGTSGVGATLTNNTTQAALTLDGVAMAVNDRVLVRSQSTGAQNGIYVVTDIGSVSTNWVLTRADDYDSTAEVYDGTYTVIEEGTTLSGRLYILTAAGTTSVTIGTTSLVFSALTVAPPSNATTSAAGIVELATDVEVEALTGGVVPTADQFPKGLLGTLSASGAYKSGNPGYLVLGPICIQWGNQNVGANSNATCTFPRAFSGTPWSVVCNYGEGSAIATNASEAATQAYSWNSTTCLLRNTENSTYHVAWFAIGPA